MAVADVETSSAERTPPPPGPSGRRVPGARDAVAILVAALVLCGLAAILGGARAVPDASWVQGAATVVALATLAAWAADRRPHADLVARSRAWHDVPLPAAFAVRATALFWLGVAGILALAFWALASMAWSARPDASWDVFNREIAYALVAATAIAVGASAPRALPRAAAGVVLVTTLVALWSLGGIVAPGAGAFAGAARDGRLHEPLSTFLELAVLCGLVAPVAVRIFASGTRSTIGRLLALAAAIVLVVVLGLTASRAGALVLLAGLATSLVAGGARLRTLAAAVLVALAAAAPLAVAFSRDDLGRDAATGRLVGLVLLAAIVVALAAAWFSLRSEDRALASFTARRAGASGLALAGLAAVALVAAALLLAASDRGLSGSVNHALDTLTATTPGPRGGAGPERLKATDSGGRALLWDEAAGAAADKPVAGWGAGAWPVVHGLYRTSDTPARDPRSSALQALAERGAVGLTLLAVALLALMAGVAWRLRVLPTSRARDLTGAALGVGAGLLVAAAISSSWEVPAIVLPALLLLGVAAARPEVPDDDDLPPFADPDPDEDRWRWGALALGTVVIALVATSALLPAWSHGRTQAARHVLSDPAATEDDLRAAAADARLASKLDPPAIEPQLAAADVAVRRARLLEARGELLQAVDEQPDRAEAWTHLSGMASLLADRPGALAAARRAVALDPRDPAVLALAREKEAQLAPPSSSPTATGTPLPGFVVGG